MSQTPVPRRPPSAPQLRWSDLIPSRRQSWRDITTSDPTIYTSSGRAAIFQYLNLRRQVVSQSRNVVLIPAFHCPTVVDPVLHAGFRVRFYSIDDELAVSRADFLAKLDGAVAAALFIRYFGIEPPDPHLVSATRQSGATVIDDCSHSFLQTAPLGAAYAHCDATTYSFWKLIPTVSGGGLRVYAGGELELALRRPGVRSSLRQMESMLRELKDSTTDSIASALRRPRPLHADQIAPAPVQLRTAAEAYPYDRQAAFCSMPRSARHVLGKADLETVVAVRRRNFEILARGLHAPPHSGPVWTDLPASACPWGFPVRLRAREKKDYLIRASGVPVFSFGELLHPLLFEQHRPDEPIVKSAKALSDSLLALSIHQQLEVQTMETSLSIMNRFLSAD